MNENDEKLKPYAKRNTDLFTQVHLHIPIELNQQLGNFANRDGLTRAAWVSTVLTKVIENDGKVTEARLDTSNLESRLDKIDSALDDMSKKVDTLTNLISVLITQSSGK